jgi:predicted transcriptional regulator
MSEVRLPCEIVARYVLPVFRSHVAKELVEKHNFTQVQAAERLGTTQAAISQYIHSKRGYKGAEEFEAILPVVQSAAIETAELIATERMDTDDVMLNFCKLCMSLREENRLE